MMSEPGQSIDPIQTIVVKCGQCFRLKGCPRVDFTDIENCPLYKEA